MTINKLSVFLVSFVLSACSSKPESEPDLHTEPYTAPGGVAAREYHERMLKEFPDYERRRAIEGLHIKTQLLLARPREEDALTEVRADGLLQRKVSLEVIAVFAGKQPEPIVHAYEIVAPLQVFKMNGEPGIVRLKQQAFMSKEPKAKIVRLVPCLEENGQERLVVVKAYVPSASQLQELREDGMKYSPQMSGSLAPCIRGSLQAVERAVDLIELDGISTELKLEGLTFR